MTSYFLEYKSLQDDLLQGRVDYTLSEDQEEVMEEKLEALWNKLSSEEMKRVKEELLSDNNRQTLYKRQQVTTEEIISKEEKVKEKRLTFVDKIAERYVEPPFMDVVRGGINAIPIVGSALDNIVANRGYRLQTNKILELIKELQDSFEKLDESSINNEYLTTDNFGYFVYDVFNKVAQERDLSKIKYFKNVFINGIAKDRKDDLVLEHALNILSNLSNAEIIVLKYFRKIWDENENDPTSTTINPAALMHEGVDKIDLGLPAKYLNITTIKSLVSKDFLMMTEAYTGLEKTWYWISDLGYQFIDLIMKLPNSEELKGTVVN